MFPSVIVLKEDILKQKKGMQLRPRAAIPRNEIDKWVLRHYSGESFRVTQWTEDSVVIVDAHYAQWNNPPLDWFICHELDLLLFRENYHGDTDLRTLLKFSR